MKINDEYHDKFREWIRDLREVGYDKDARRNQIERNVFCGYEAKENENYRLGMIDDSSAVATILGMGAVALSAGYSLATSKPLLLVWSSTPLVLGLVGRGSTYLIRKLNNAKMEEIKKTAENQRYAREHGARKRGMMKHTLDSL